jgi:hypothetical protein
VTLRWWPVVAWGLIVLLPALLASVQALRHKQPPRWLGARRSEYRCYAVGTTLLAVGPFIMIYLSLVLDSTALAIVGGSIWILGGVLRVRRPGPTLGAGR